MVQRSRFGLVVLTGVFVCGLVVGSLVQVPRAVQAQTAGVYELRTYTSPAGKLGDLQTRFRNHTLRIFEKHGMENVGYWVPTDTPASENTLIYILKHDSRDAAARSWEAFIADPEWQQVYEESQRDGRLASHVESVFMNATDYSPMK